MRVNESTVRQRLLELAPQLAHVDVDRPVSYAKRAAPDGHVELLAGYDRAEAPGQRDEEFELAHGQRQGPAGREDQPFLQSDLELAGVEDISLDVRALRKGRHDAERRTLRRSRSCKLVIYR